MFSELLKSKKFIILDGAMGTQLQARGLKTGECPEAINVTHPDTVMEIHRSYIEAGSDIVYTNTFGANRYKLAESGYSVSELVKAGIQTAKKAAGESGVLAALDIGPIGQLMEPTGSMSFDKAYDIYKEVILAGEEADLIVFETMTDLLELKAGVLAAKENSTKPVICTMTFEENMRTFTGCSVSAMALTMQGLGVDAIGVNCSLGPVQLKDVVGELAKWTNLPIIVKPNAGLPDPSTGEYDLTPDPQQAQPVLRFLKRHGLEADIRLGRDLRGRLVLQMTGEDLSSIQDGPLLEALSRNMGMSFALGPLERDRAGQRLTLVQEDNYQATAGVAALSKEGETVSGDGGNWFRDKDGRLWVVLCDGMGSGRLAAEQSHLALRLLEDFLRAGVSPEIALATLSNALALRGEQEVGFTTIDLVGLDLFSGEGQSYKLGAGPTYLRQSGRVKKLSGTSLPAGLEFGQRAEPDVCSFQLGAPPRAPPQARAGNAAQRAGGPHFGAQSRGPGRPDRIGTPAEQADKSPKSGAGKGGKLNGGIFSQLCDHTDSKLGKVWKPW